ncbi:distal tail protein [Rhodobacteraceae phage LS06-2018-MD06]|nr:distal tail protein [Rhodobacteraceae phage LS06-2018-MD06]
MSVRNTVQYIVYGEGGTVGIYLLSKPTTATITIETDMATSLVENQNATIDTFSSVLSNSASAGNATFDLTNASGLSSGDFVVINPLKEYCEVKTVTANTVVTWQPLVYSHNAADTVETVKVSYDVSNTQASQLFYGGRCKWVIDGETHVQSLECTRWPIRFTTTMSDVYAIDPGFIRFVDKNENIDTTLRKAYSDVMFEIGGRGRIHIFTAGPEFNNLVSLKYLCTLFGRHGEKTADLKEHYVEEYERMLGKIISALPVDSNQDEVASENERIFFGSIPLYRG